MKSGGCMMEKTNSMFILGVQCSGGAKELKVFNSPEELLECVIYFLDYESVGFIKEISNTGKVHELGILYENGRLFLRRKLNNTINEEHPCARIRVADDDDIRM
jgi:hypothetical protein